jgi:tRNA modification GTPase
LPLATTELAVRALLAQTTAWHDIAEKGSPGEGAAALADRSLYWLLHPPRIAIVGVPNVGKSTLANQLLARDRLITSNVAGTTRDWVGELANLDGLAVMLVDTPGVRETIDPVEREAIARSRVQVKAADLVILVLDPTQPHDAGQAALAREHPGALWVVNKADLKDGGWDQAIRTVATSGQGVDALRNAIRMHFLGPAPFEFTRRRWWTERQKEFLTRTPSVTS